MKLTNESKFSLDEAAQQKILNNVILCKVQVPHGSTGVPKAGKAATKNNQHRPSKSSCVLPLPGPLVGFAPPLFATDTDQCVVTIAIAIHLGIHLESAPKAGESLYV